MAHLERPTFGASEGSCRYFGTPQVLKQGHTLFVFVQKRKHKNMHRNVPSGTFLQSEDVFSQEHFWAVLRGGAKKRPGEDPGRTSARALRVKTLAEL